MSRIKFVAATNNKNKLKEFARILKPLDIEVVTAAECGGDDINPEENGSTFEENAVIKARAFAQTLGLPALADDSGLCVDALDGAPGVYSARYSGGGSAENNAMLLKNLEGVPMEKRTARFVCVICCAYPNGGYFIVRGECEGKIGFEPKGSDGFGYDPIFLTETGESFAEISAERKDEISHRGKALRLLARRLEENKEIDPNEKFDELKEFFKDYDFTVHTHGDKSEKYTYLKEGCYCITVKNLSGYELFVDWNGEFTLEFGDWHAHFAPTEGEYHELIEYLTEILGNKRCAFSIFVNGDWRGSSLEDVIISNKSDAKKHMKSDFAKDFAADIKKNGCEAHYTYWNSRLSVVIKFEPGEF